MNASAYDAKNGSKADYYNNPDQFDNKKFQGNVSAGIEEANRHLATLTKISLSPANDKMNQVQGNWIQNVLRLFKDPNQ